MEKRQGRQGEKSPAPASGVGAARRRHQNFKLNSDGRLLNSGSRLLNSGSRLLNSGGRLLNSGGRLL
ncbi:hypothetical protein, partial [Nostoc sp. ChiQUE01b]|uniref:hypothetical protein n=1 Tax=Nostoc sp. ChiQUE01b TaxID=3075376 RepID=UPI002AD20396